MRIRQKLGAMLAALFTGGAATAEEVEVLLETTHGDIALAVDIGRAPVTAANFLRYIDGGHYDGGSFYRTVTRANDNGDPKIEVIQGGRGSDSTPVFAPIKHEPTNRTGLRHEHGTLSMARGAPGSAASEFFICIGDQPGLDAGATRNADGKGFAAFGRVTAGMEVVTAIHEMPSNAPAPNVYLEGQLLEVPVEIISARRAE